MTFHCRYIPKTGNAPRRKLGSESKPSISYGAVCRAVLSRSVVSNSSTRWTVARQAPLSGFSRQEHWSGLPCPPQGDLPNPGLEPRSPTLQEDSLPTEPSGKPLYYMNNKEGILLHIIMYIMWRKHGSMEREDLLENLGFKSCSDSL